MRVNFTSFNYQPGADFNAEERNYLGYHVQLAKALPGLRFYATGVFRNAHGVKPSHYRAAILAFDSADAAADAMRTETGRKVRQDGADHLIDARPLAFDATEIVPFDSREVGRTYFMMAAEADLKPAHGETLAAAEDRYLHYHTGVARQLPGLRGYTIGRLVETRGAVPDRFRMALLVFDSAEALRAAYRSPVGQELILDEERSIAANARVHRLDVTVQV